MDQSREMMEVARKKNCFLDRWNIMEGDIQNLLYDDNSFDVVINTHNVLGFVEDKNLAIKEMSRVLKENGKLISVIPNKYHGLFFNIFQNNLIGAENLHKNTKGKFVNMMPEIDFFTPELIKKIYGESEIVKIKCLGFPLFIYPGFNETQLNGESKNVKDVLEAGFERLFELEMNYVNNEELSSRGNNLFVIGEKIKNE